MGVWRPPGNSTTFTIRDFRPRRWRRKRSFDRSVVKKRQPMKPRRQPVDSLSRRETASAPGQEAKSGSQRLSVPRGRATCGLPGGYRKGITCRPRPQPMARGERYR
jgi:hypothetical protein